MTLSSLASTPFYYKKRWTVFSIKKGKTLPPAGRGTEKVMFYFYKRSDTKKR